MLILRQISIVYLIVHAVETKPRNNACKSVEGYLDLDNSPDCYYEEDLTLIAPDLIRKYAGTLETYKMTTADGYKLTMFRIPRAKPKGVVLLHHPLNTNSNAYTFAGNRSFAIELWQSGYDVWLNNHRGSNFSLLHTHLSALQYEYWNFTFHEIAIFDLVAQIDVIREQTNNSSIMFYGYSMGADVGLVYASMFPEQAREYFKVFVLSGVPCYFRYAKGPTLLFGHTIDITESLFDYLKLGTTLAVVPTLRYLAKYIVMQVPTYHFLHSEVFQFIFGRTQDQYEPLFAPVDLLFFVDYFPVKVMIQIGQLIKAKNRFQWYDYGKDKNIEQYGTERPPVYELEKIIAPVYLVSGIEDIMTSSKDTDDLFETISPSARIYGQLKMKNFNHIDFIFGKQTKGYHDQIIQFLDRISTN